MHRFLAILIIFPMLFTQVCADELQPAPEGWVYLGYTHGGINFMVPDDTQFWELYPSEKSMGIILLGGNADYTIQLRQFSPETLSIETFKTQILNEPTASVTVVEEDKGTLVYYQNTAPNANSELFGIVLEGIDGNIYKISIFTGEDGAFGPMAKVWQIAQTIADNVSLQEFSDWPIS